MVATSQVPAVLDYLVSAFTAAATLGASPTAPVAIYDGPATTEQAAQLVLWVGLDDPDGTGGRRGAISTQDWAAIGRLVRTEDITIHCAADAWLADAVRGARVAAYGITAAVETILHDDSSLGGLAFKGNAAIVMGELWQNNTDRGALARVLFDITAQARIGG